MVDFWYKYILVPEQAARTFPDGTPLICVYSEQHKMRSQLAAQFMPFFRLIARTLTFRDKKYRILTFRDKTELYITVLQLNNVEAC